MRSSLLGLALVASAWAAEAQEAPVDAPVEVAPAPAPAARTFTLDPAKSWLYVVIFNDSERWTAVPGHDHGIKATTFTGSVTWDAANPAACKVDIRFPVTALAVDPPGMRARAGLPEEGGIGEGAKSTVIGNMTGKSQLWASQHPEIAYSASGCAPRSDGRFDVTGTLTIRGVGKKLTVPMKIQAAGSGFSASGTFTLNHSDFGFSPFTYGPATPKNLEKLEFHVDVVGSG